MRNIGDIECTLVIGAECCVENHYNICEYRFTAFSFETERDRSVPHVCVPVPGHDFLHLLSLLLQK